MSSEFEKTNPAWDLRLWQQRTGEWFEYLISGWKPPEIPENDPSPPPEIAPEFWESAFWLIVIGLAIVIVWNLYPIVERYFTQVRPDRPKPPPPVPDLTQSEWLARARLAQSNGDYTQACRALYLAMVKQLQDKSILTPDPSLTNGDYRKLLKTRPQPHAYRTLINAHDESIYTDRPLTQDRYAECDRAYRDITRDLDQEVAQ
jgi:Domain of unknown function (DUF4129)